METFQDMQFYHVEIFLDMKDLVLNFVDIPVGIQVMQIFQDMQVFKDLVSHTVKYKLCPGKKIYWE